MSPRPPPPPGRRVDLTIEKCRLIDPAKAPYDVCLDEFERGMSSARLDAFFKEMSAGLVPLLAAVKARADAGGHGARVASHPAPSYLFSFTAASQLPSLDAQPSQKQQRCPPARAQASKSKPDGSWIVGGEFDVAAQAKLCEEVTRPPAHPAHPRLAHSLPIVYPHTWLFSRTALRICPCIRRLRSRWGSAPTAAASTSPRTPSRRALYHPAPSSSPRRPHRPAERIAEKVACSECPRLRVSVRVRQGGAGPEDVRMTTRFKPDDLTEARLRRLFPGSAPESPRNATPSPPVIFARKWPWRLEAPRSGFLCILPFLPRFHLRLQGLTGAIHETGHALYEQVRRAAKPALMLLCSRRQRRSA